MNETEQKFEQITETQRDFLKQTFESMEQDLQKNPDIPWDEFTGKYALIMDKIFQKRDL